MAELLGALAIVMVAAVAVGVAVGSWALHQLRRRNRVSRRYRTRAPLHWLVSPGTCARLHRRLRDAVAVLRTTVPTPSRRRLRPAEPAPLATAADELEAHAAALDGDLLLAARLRGAPGQELRRRLANQVGDVERLSARVAAAATAAAPPRSGAQPSPAALAELDEQLDALEAARDELARLEAGVGLVSAPVRGRPPIGVAVPSAR